MPPLLLTPLAVLLLAAAPTVHARAPAPTRATALGPYVVLAWNDLGMHCMNQYFGNFAVLPPYNNLRAQVILRGDTATLPRIVTLGIGVTYSIPGNTYSVGKTDFWTYAPAMFGPLAPNVGLTGRGLTGTMTPVSGMFTADGVPVTPFTDAAPTVESPYQNALVIAADGLGHELARSTPTIPVSVDLGCVSAGCHASEQAVLDGHPAVSGFNPANKPILCAGCHADPALGAPGNAEADYFSFRMHDTHSFIDQQFPGVAGCYKCHPGTNPKCLRGVMSQKWGVGCPDCHGQAWNVAWSIPSGRVPWVNEPACSWCHTSRFYENTGALYKLSLGHGGVACEGCHNSTHAEVTSREAADNANNIALQGFAGPLIDCTVCHGYSPSGPGPHGLVTMDVGRDLLAGARPLVVAPNPVRGSCVIEARGALAADSRMLVHDVQGRVVRLLRPAMAGEGRVRVTWDGRDGNGARLPAGTYFVRWLSGGERAAARVTLIE